MCQVGLWGHVRHFCVHSAPSWAFASLFLCVSPLLGVAEIPATVPSEETEAQLADVPCKATQLCRAGAQD